MGIARCSATRFEKRSKRFRANGAPAPRRKSSRIFLLSPANLTGIRGRWFTEGRVLHDLGQRLLDEGVPVGELFAFISSLYFRGKLAYAQAFGRGPAGVPAAWVITSCFGLVPADQLIGLPELRAISSVPIDLREPRYRVPLERKARALARAIGRDCEVVLLGSIATGKYADPLVTVFGERLLFPAEFVGRGDMSRGGLMLRCVGAFQELTYRPVSGSVRHGARPPKLAPISEAKR
jgi:hypothetical protein